MEVTTEIRSSADQRLPPLITATEGGIGRKSLRQSYSIASDWIPGRNHAMNSALAAKNGTTCVTGDPKKCNAVPHMQTRNSNA